MVYLREVDEETVEQCAGLRCTQEQCQFANSPVWTLLQAAYCDIRGKCRVFAIKDECTVVGMIRLDFSVFPDCYMFTNLLIDQKYQRKHYATEAVKAALDIFKKDGRHSIVRIHVAKENCAAIGLYEKTGFRRQPEEETEDFYTYSINIMICR